MAYIEKYDDTTEMPFGKAHKGKPLGEIPDSYFLWFWGENRDDYYNAPAKMWPEKAALMDYIRDSFENLP